MWIDLIKLIAVLLGVAVAVVLMCKGLKHIIESMIYND